jgi:hypothetical protein
MKPDSTLADTIKRIAPKPDALSYEDIIDCGNSGDVYDAGYNDALRYASVEFTAHLTQLRELANRITACLDTWSKNGGNFVAYKELRKVEADFVAKLGSLEEK